jgi:hypothetical protein
VALVTVLETIGFEMTMLDYENSYRTQSFASSRIIIALYKLYPADIHVHSKP